MMNVHIYVIEVKEQKSNCSLKVEVITLEGYVIKIIITKIITKNYYNFQNIKII